MSGGINNRVPLSIEPTLQSAFAYTYNEPIIGCTYHSVVIRTYNWRFGRTFLTRYPVIWSHIYNTICRIVSR